MKSKRLIIATVLFFILVNTTYYWEGKLGLFAILAFLLLSFVYFILTIILFRQLYFSIKEKLANKTRLLTIGILILVLTLVFYKPYGLINFDQLQGDDILIAEREGSANCMTTFKLKDNYTFREKSVCFGVTEVKGKYYLLNDTIFFSNVNVGRNEDAFYQFALIKPSMFISDGKHFDLIFYMNIKDTIGYELWITKNELNKLKGKKSSQ